MATLPLDAPSPPEPPLPGDCCGNGCSPCVWDLHAEALDAWRRRIEETGHANEAGA